MPHSIRPGLTIAQRQHSAAIVLAWLLAERPSLSVSWRISRTEPDLLRGHVCEPSDPRTLAALSDVAKALGTLPERDGLRLWARKDVFGVRVEVWALMESGWARMARDTQEAS